MSSSLYETDIVAWAEQQSRLLRALAQVAQVHHREDFKPIPDTDLRADLGPHGLTLRSLGGHSFRVDAEEVYPLTKWLCARSILPPPPPPKTAAQLEEEQMDKRLKEIRITTLINIARDNKSIKMRRAALDDLSKELGVVIGDGKGMA